MNDGVIARLNRLNGRPARPGGAFILVVVAAVISDRIGPARDGTHYRGQRTGAENNHRELKNAGEARSTRHSQSLKC
jgi:hypothetical protein